MRTASAAATPRSQRAHVLPLVYTLARQYDIDAQLVRAIITVESNFNTGAISRAGAQGLMQLMPATVVRYGVADPFEPKANIEGGIRFLKDLWHNFQGDVHRVLAAYNAGEGAVIQYGGIPPYPETQRYVARVLALYNTYGTSSRIYRYRMLGGRSLFTIPRGRSRCGCETPCVNNPNTANPIAKRTLCFQNRQNHRSPNGHST